MSAPPPRLHGVPGTQPRVVRRVGRDLGGGCRLEQYGSWWASAARPMQTWCNCMVAWMLQGLHSNEIGREKLRRLASSASLLPVVWLFYCPPVSSALNLAVVTTEASPWA
jgi:hypothetical protein